MRRKFGSLADFDLVEGSAILSLPDLGARRLGVSIVTEGASVFVREDGRDVLVACGVGFFDLDVGVVGQADLIVKGFKANLVTSVRLDGVKPRFAGWTGNPSLTDLEPRRMGEVSPEVAAMFQTMQANMARLEAQLRERSTGRA